MLAKTLDINILSNWIGKTEQSSDLITAQQANLMCATLGRPQNLSNGDPLPALWHWLYFPVALPPDQLGRDGHPQLGGFSPPVDLPRRMWAGGRFEFFAPVLIAERATKTSRIERIEMKNGRTGPLCFVTVSHMISVNGKPRLREEHDIVYRQASTKDAPMPTPIHAPKTFDWQREIMPDPVMLFRYSALMFNGHRIHYDRAYAREVEGYSDLVVHGPLIATLLADLACQKDLLLHRFSYRALAPVFDTTPFMIEGKDGETAALLWAKNPDGTLAMQAEATFYPNNNNSSNR